MDHEHRCDTGIELPKGVILGKNYIVIQKIGEGSFGHIYLAKDCNGNDYAVKGERVGVPHPQLMNERRLYQLIKGGIGVPEILWHGSAAGFNVIVMEMLGPTLEDLYNTCSRKFSMKTMIMLTDQMIMRLQHAHSRNVIHRDIKPENFLMGGKNAKNTVFLVDFGLATKFRNIETRQHIPYREGRRLVGTSRYVSLNAHNGCTLSRRDDMESLGYVLMYFLRGSLPWQGLHAETVQQKYEVIHEKKMSTPLDELCHGFPSEFLLYILYCRSLKFDQQPDYYFIRERFRLLFFSLGHQHSNSNFDWWELSQQTVAQSVNEFAVPKPPGPKPKTKTPGPRRVRKNNNTVTTKDKNNDGKD